MMTSTDERDTGRAEDLALVAVQLELSIDDFASETRYAQAIERATDGAMRAAGDATHRLLVFPENAGHFLPLVHAPGIARKQKTVDRAMAVFAARHPGRLLRTMWRERTLNAERGLMLATMPRAVALMREVFSNVARRANAYVVAGSHLAPQGGQVSNTSYTFDPRGRLIGTTNKVNLVVGLEDDSPGGIDLARGRPEDVPIIEAPWGRLCTLICYDGFSVPHTKSEPGFVSMGEKVRARGAQVIANPSANPWPWNDRWVHADAGDETLRREQWRREGLFSTLDQLGPGPGVVYGITAHLCARILDFEFHGRSEILVRTDQGTEVLAQARTDDRGDAVVARVPTLVPNRAVDVGA